MATTQVITCSNDTRRAVRGDKCRCTWTTKEEEALLAALKELVAKGFKSDNGFRPGYLRKLEDSMRKAFPENDLKARPHIQSRLTTWKKNYASLLTILSRSGVGFNLTGDFEVECDDEQWPDIIKNDNNASNIQGRSWPLLEGWKVVCGKDRATGDGANDVMETLNEFLHENNEAAAENRSDKGPQNKEETIHIQEDDPNVCNSAKIGLVSNQSKKKRKVDDDTANMCELLGQIQRDTDARFETLVNRIGYQVDLGKMRKEVYNLVKVIPGLSSKQSFEACDKIICKVESLEFFMDLSEYDRPEYVSHLLSLDD